MGYLDLPISKCHSKSRRFKSNCSF